MIFILSQDTVHRRPSAERAFAEPNICCTSSVQIKGSTDLEDLDHIVPLGGLRISAQLSVREPCCLPDLFASLDVLLIPSKSPDLWVLASGPLVWMMGSTRARFQVQGESRTKGTSKCLREVLIHTSSFIVSGIRGEA